MLLSGEAIHCQYFSDGPHHHNTAQSHDPQDPTHCIIANHESAAMPSVGVSGDSEFSLLGHIHSAESPAVDSTVADPVSARAPPLS